MENAVVTTAIIVDDQGNIWCGPNWRWISASYLEDFSMHIVVYDSVEKAEKQAANLRRKSLCWLKRPHNGPARRIAVVS